MADIETVRLVRDPAEHPDSHEATVNRDDADGFLQAGWAVASEAAAPARRPRRVKHEDAAPGAEAASPETEAEPEA